MCNGQLIPCLCVQGIEGFRLRNGDHASRAISVDFDSVE